MAKPGEIDLGDVVKDSVTGFKGVAIGKTDWLNGCTRWVVQPQELDKGKMIEATSIDEPQLELVKKGKHKPLKDPGGPRPEPQRRKL